MGTALLRTRRTRGVEVIVPVLVALYLLSNGEAAGWWILLWVFVLHNCEDGCDRMHGDRRGWREA